MYTCTQPQFVRFLFLFLHFIWDRNIYWWHQFDAILFLENDLMFHCCRLCCYKICLFTFSLFACLPACLPPGSLSVYLFVHCAFMCFELSSFRHFLASYYGVNTVHIHSFFVKPITSASAQQFSESSSTCYRYGLCILIKCQRSEFVSLQTPNMCPCKSA